MSTAFFNKVLSKAISNDEFHVVVNRDRQGPTTYVVFLNKSEETLRGGMKVSGLFNSRRERLLTITGVGALDIFTSVIILENEQKGKNRL